jgi:hypothetical protein
MDIISLNFSEVKEDLKINRGSDWVSYDLDNLYPQKVVKYFNSSPINQAIVTYKSELTSGEGFLSSNTELMNYIFTNKLNLLLNKISLDFNLYGGFAIQVLSDSNGNIATLEYIDFSTIRVDKPDEDGDINGYWISRSWEEYRKNEYKPFFVSKYDINRLKEDKIQIYYFVQPYPNLYYYTKPDYSAALNYVELETKLQEYHLNTVKNGFFPSLMITFPEIPTPEERISTKLDLERTFRGTESAGKAIVSFVDGAENKIIVDTIQSNNNADLMNNLTELVTQKIISAHRLSSPTLAGLPGAGSLGGNASEISTAYEFFYNTVIKRKQNMIIDVFKELLLNLFNDVDLSISNTKPLIYVPENILKDNFTRNEIREMYGYAPIEEKIQESLKGLFND